MEERNYYRTLIRKEDSLGEKEYVIGRISGMKAVLCDNGVNYAIAQTFRGRILTTYCTDEQYELFVDFVERYYPKLCVFYYVGSKQSA